MSPKHDDLGQSRKVEPTGEGEVNRLCIAHFVGQKLAILENNLPDRWLEHTAQNLEPVMPG